MNIFSKIIIYLNKYSNETANEEPSNPNSIINITIF